MVTIMNMVTGRPIEDEFGAFAEEVLNAQWLPQPLQLQLGLQKANCSAKSRTVAGMDADAFLRNIYAYQE